MFDFNWCPFKKSTLRRHFNFVMAKQLIGSFHNDGNILWLGWTCIRTEKEINDKHPFSTRLCCTWSVHVRRIQCFYKWLVIKTRSLPFSITSSWRVTLQYLQWFLTQSPPHPDLLRHISCNDRNSCLPPCRTSAVQAIAWFFSLSKLMLFCCLTDL